MTRPAPAPMNPLALAWAERELKRLERIELAHMVRDLQLQQAELRPLLAAAEARRKANMRQDGPRGFVMVMP